MAGADHSVGKDHRARAETWVQTASNTPADQRLGTAVEQSTCSGGGPFFSGTTHLQQGGRMADPLALQLERRDNTEHRTH